MLALRLPIETVSWWMIMGVEMRRNTLRPSGCQRLSQASRGERMGPSCRRPGRRLASSMRPTAACLGRGRLRLVLSLRESPARAPCRQRVRRCGHRGGQLRIWLVVQHQPHKFGRRAGVRGCNGPRVTGSVLHVSGHLRGVRIFLLSAVCHFGLHSTRREVRTLAANANVRKRGVDPTSRWLPPWGDRRRAKRLPAKQLPVQPI
jgi:hypothetical protein